MVSCIIVIIIWYLGGYNNLIEIYHIIFVLSVIDKIKYNIL